MYIIYSFPVKFDQDLFKIMKEVFEHLKISHLNSLNTVQHNKHTEICKDIIGN